MYIIEGDKAYLVKGDKAYLVTFEPTKSEISEKDFIEVKEQRLYTYDEVYRKLNIEYNFKVAEQKKKIKEVNSKEFEKYEEKIKDLEEGNKKLKSEIESSKKSNK